MKTGINHLEKHFSYKNDIKPEENYIVSLIACKHAYNEGLGDVLLLIQESDKYWYNQSPDSQERCLDLYDIIDNIKKLIK